MRKQVHELSLADLRRVPAWEFALDEEGLEGQDEATVRPHDFKEIINPSDGMLIVRAQFVLADGSKHLGYMTPPSDDDHGLGALQPVVVGEIGQVMFWLGTLEPSRVQLDASYSRLGKTRASQVFPVRFRSDVPLIGGPSSGEIEGFLVLEDWRSGRTRVRR